LPFVSKQKFARALAAAGVAPVERLQQQQGIRESFSRQRRLPKPRRDLVDGEGADDDRGERISIEIVLTSWRQEGDSLPASRERLFQLSSIA